MRTDPRRIALAAFGAAALLVGAAPAHANNGNCFFRVNGSFSLAFGLLDPSSGASRNALAAVATLQSDEVGDCRNVTFTISADNGQNFGGGMRRLSNGTDFIPYSLTLPVSGAAPGNNRWTTFSFGGSVAGTAYENASAGNYSDTVIISVTP